MQNLNLKNIKTIIFDFDGVFTNNKVSTNQEGIESVICDKSDSLGISILKKYIKKNNLSIDIFVLSTESNSVIAKRTKKLDLKYYQSIENKYKFLKDYFNSKHLDLEEALKTLLYVGNDLNDLEIITKAGFSACPSDANKLIRKVSKIKLESQGGDGCIRELIDKLLNIENLKFEELIKIT